MKSTSLAKHTLTNHVKKIGKSKCKSMMTISMNNMMISKRTFTSINKDVTDNIKQQMDLTVLRASSQEKNCEDENKLPTPCEIKQDYSNYAMSDFCA